jgi:excisionase family DNA binding protein
MTQEYGEEPVVLTVKEVSQLLRIHRPKVYELIREGSIQGFKLGADWRVTRESVEKLVGRIPKTFFKKEAPLDFTKKAVGVTKLNS